MVIRRGFTYPMATDGNGSLALSTDDDYALVYEAIYSVLETRPKERIMRNRYGTPDYSFSVVADASFIPSRIRFSLTEQVADPDSFDVQGAYSEDGLMSIAVTPTINSVEQPPVRFTLKA